MPGGQPPPRRTCSVQPPAQAAWLPWADYTTLGNLNWQLTMARRLLHPDPLDEDWRSGLFLSGLRRTGKTTFLRNDLIP